MHEWIVHWYICCDICIYVVIYAGICFRVFYTWNKMHANILFHVIYFYYNTVITVIKVNDIMSSDVIHLHGENWCISYWLDYYVILIVYVKVLLLYTYTLLEKY